MVLESIICMAIFTSHSYSCTVLPFSSFTFSPEIEDEEIDESTSEEPISESDDTIISSQLVDVKEVHKISWLLQVVLTNLRVKGYGHNSQVQSVTMVRIESKISLNIRLNFVC